MRPLRTRRAARSKLGVYGNCSATNQRGRDDFGPLRGGKDESDESEIRRRASEMDGASCASGGKLISPERLVERGGSRRVSGPSLPTHRLFRDDALACSPRLFDNGRLGRDRQRQHDRVDIVAREQAVQPAILVRVDCEVVCCTRVLFRRLDEGLDRAAGPGIDGDEVEMLRCGDGGQVLRRRDTSESARSNTPRSM